MGTFPSGRGEAPAAGGLEMSHHQVKSNLAAEQLVWAISPPTCTTALRCNPGVSFILVVFPQKPFCIILPFLLLHPPSSSTHPGSEPSAPCYRNVLSSDLCKCKLTLLASSLNPIAKITVSPLSAPLAIHSPVPPVPYAGRYRASLLHP